MGDKTDFLRLGHVYVVSFWHIFYDNKFCGIVVDTDCPMYKDSLSRLI